MSHDLQSSPNWWNIVRSVAVFVSRRAASFGGVRSSEMSPLKTPNSPRVLLMKVEGKLVVMSSWPARTDIMRDAPGEQIANQCQYMYAHARMHARTHARTNARTHTCTHACSQARMQMAAMLSCNNTAPHAIASCQYNFCFTQ